MKYPLITIGIATYNASRSIERVIKSALSQSWEPLEIIIVDDCSEDNTYKKLKKISSKHKEIRVYKNTKNYGVAYVRNVIIKKTRGEFLAFFDDDDESMPERLKMQYQRILEYEKNFKTSSLIVCHSSRKVIYPNGKIRTEGTLGTKIYSTSPFGLSVARRILLGEPLKDGYGACPTCCQMARISTYLKAGGFDKRFRRSEDTEFCVRLAMKGAHFVGIRNPLVLQRMTKTADKSIDIEFKYANLLLKKHKDFIERNGNYKFCIYWQKIKYSFYKRELKKIMTIFFFLIINYPRKTLIRLFQSLKSIQINMDFLLFHK